MLASIALPQSSAPRVSIVLLTRGPADVFNRCLRALASHLPRHIPLETVVLLNGCHADLRACARGVTGLVLLESDVDLGFPAGCNQAASHARGDLLVLLNDDTEIEPGWLEALVAAVDTQPRIGAVGSLLLFPDGRVQEAGSLIWSDGWTTPVGRGDDPRAPVHRYTRRVDFCSACSLLVPRSAWDAAGGFCEAYHPGYYEDVDLCVVLRQLGLHVLYAPQSRVRHYAYTTGSPARDLLILRNRGRFVARHAAILEEDFPSRATVGVRQAVMWSRGNLRHLLVIDDRLPNGSLGSGYGRMREALTDLTAGGYAVTIWPADGDHGLVDELGCLGIEVAHGDVEAHLAEPERLYDVVVISRPHQFAAYAESVRALQPQAALVYDAEALFHRRLERQSSLSGNIEHAREAAALREVEEHVGAGADVIIAVSEDEGAFFSRHGAAGRVSVVVPRPSGRLTTAPFRERSGALLVAGWLGGPASPNVDGLVWFAREVLPLVLTRVPWFRLAVTGAHPPPEATTVAGTSISFLGQIDDLYAVYNASRISLSPLRFGSGLKMKVVEAIGHGVPVVATPLGAEGIPPVEGGAIWIAETPGAFADAIAALLLDRHTWGTKPPGRPGDGSAVADEPVGDLARCAQSRPTSPPA